jgi:hypothetical protein
LKLELNYLLSNFAFNFNMRRYNLALQAQAETKDDLIMSLSQQAEAGSPHFVHVAYFALSSLTLHQ